ncbi:MAG TPA: aminopeptidase, partial [Alphaproteobacteria bacterium]|nr:aminopeptidase [Alphaproteobacteria bacterium]
DEPAFGRTLIDMVIDKDNPLGAVAGLPGCTLDVLEAGYSKENNPQFVKELYDFLQNEKEIIITSELGTNLILNININKYNWIASDGIVVPKKYRNPIPAEVYTYPENVNGRFVITGSYGHFTSLPQYKNNFGQLVEDLKKTPMTWYIKDGKIIDVLCDNEELKKAAIKEIYDTDKEHGMKIGEIGIPANLYILKRKLTGQLLIDEKGRVHMANGDGYADMTNCEYKSKVHSDGLAEKVTLYSPRFGKNFMENDVYNPDIFPSLRK